MHIDYARDSFDPASTTAGNIHAYAPPCETCLRTQSPDQLGASTALRATTTSIASTGSGCRKQCSFVTAACSKAARGSKTISLMAWAIDPATKMGYRPVSVWRGVQKPTPTHFGGKSISSDIAPRAPAPWMCTALNIEFRLWYFAKVRKKLHSARTSLFIYTFRHLQRQMCDTVRSRDYG